MSAIKKKQRRGRNPTSVSAPPRLDSSQTLTIGPVKKSGFPIVGIGASAGGLEALEQLFKNMPADTGMAFVVLTHQHPGRVSLLPDLLDKQATMTVVEAANGMKVQPNHVYVGPPGGHLSIHNGILQRTDTADPESPRLPIDFFLRSLAIDQKERAICIILSGTGSDGSLGVKAIKAEAGMVMVQQPQTAKFAGMPSSAIATGLIDYTLPPAGMPQQLLAYAKGPYLGMSKATAGVGPIPAEPLQKILRLLRDRTGHDFSAYKVNSVNRRIERRMNLHQIHKIDDYVRYLQTHPHELDILFKELLISVTNFFRDAEAWEALSPYLETLVKSRPEQYTLRVWVPGCATGEEAFSIAIMLRECMDRLNRDLGVQIFATDLDPGALESARAAEYPAGIAVDIAPKRLERYFTQDDGIYRVRKDVRQMVVFAQQSVIKDPPFTRLDLLSCRNLLIYLNSDLQKKLIPIFHYALKPGGLLFLGPSETLGTSSDLFDTVDRHWKIFRRRENLRALHTLPKIPAQPADEGESQLSAALSVRAKDGRTSQFERVLLTRFVPASIVVNDRGEILYIHGHTGTYLEPAPGEPTHNVLNMLREGLQIELPAALRECIRKGKDVVREDIRVKANDQFVHTDLTVSKITSPEALRGLFLITFRPASTEPAPGKATAVPKKSVDRARIQRLERELQRTKESHQITLEELEASNEGLKSANEELQSINEELQSANEELETSKEEMQSLNEELTTLNSELQSKLNELSQSNDDMENLLNSISIATIFIDNELNVKRFTKQAQELIKLREGDVGRPIVELTSNLQYDLAGACRDVLNTLGFREAEVRTNDGKWFLMRLLPYRTADGIIDGLVLTFVNIVELKRVHEAGVRARVYFEGIADTAREPLLVLDKEFRVIFANRAYYQTFHAVPRHTEGKLIFQLGNRYWDIPKLHKLLENILPEAKIAEAYKVEVKIPGFGRRIFLINARQIEQLPSSGDLILLAMEERTAG